MVLPKFTDLRCTFGVFFFFFNLFCFLPVTLTKIHHRCRLLFFWNLYDSRQCRRFHSFHASKNAKYLSIRNNSPLFLLSIDSSALFCSPMGFSPFFPENRDWGQRDRDRKTVLLSRNQETKNEQLIWIWSLNKG